MRSQTPLVPWKEEELEVLMFLPRFCEVEGLAACRCLLQPAARVYQSEDFHDLGLCERGEMMSGKQIAPCLVGGQSDSPPEAEMIPCLLY